MNANFRLVKGKKPKISEAERASTKDNPENGKKEDNHPTKVDSRQAPKKKNLGRGI